jgi:hypothetical protein
MKKEEEDMSDGDLKMYVMLSVYVIVWMLIIYYILSCV